MSSKCIQAYKQFILYHCHKSCRNGHDNIVISTYYEKMHQRLFTIMSVCKTVFYSVKYTESLKVNSRTAARNSYCIYGNKKTPNFITFATKFNAAFLIMP
jgi:hypothetical protein